MSRSCHDANRHAERARAAPAITPNHARTEFHNERKRNTQGERNLRNIGAGN
jgi:hypothetical protein